MDVGTIERLRAFDARLRGVEPETARLDRIA
jgi:hypothetical protein